MRMEIVRNLVIHDVLCIRRLHGHDSGACGGEDGWILKTWLGAQPEKHARFMRNHSLLTSPIFLAMKSRSKIYSNTAKTLPVCIECPIFCESDESRRLIK